MSEKIAPKGAQTKKKDKDKKNDLFWVGIGASAGGLEALKTLVMHLPKYSNMTFIIAQHLSPTHKSMLVELIARETPLKVCEVEDGVSPQRDTVYITPAKNEIFVKSNRLFLRNSANKMGPKPSINFFFNSLASEKGHHSLGIILSGSGSDGAHGIRAIRAAGGITIAQDEKTAKYFSMPDAAIKTDCVDLILPPDEIATTLPKIINTPRNLFSMHKEETSSDIFQNIFRVLKRYSGVDFSDYKKGTIGRRIERRMAARGLHEVAQYLNLLQEDTHEVDVLFKDLLISVTSFFRDADPFAALKKYVKKIVDKNEGQNIRVWIPGCASGEEAYSIAILFAEEMGVEQFMNSKIVFFATDIDQDALNIARKASYPVELTENIGEKLLHRYFDVYPESCKVKKFLKSKIVFSKHDVISEPPFSRINLVACRNLLIYFNNNLQNRVLQILHYSLGLEGVLFLGKSESLGDSEELFTPVDSGNKIFLKKYGTDNSLTSYPSVLRTRFQTLETTKTKPGSTNIQSVSEKLVSVMAPNSILYDEKLNIRHIYGDIRQFVDITPGNANMNMMNILMKPVSQEIHSLTYKSLNDNVVAKGHYRKFDDAYPQKKVSIVVYPVFTDLEYEKLFLAAFTVTEETESMEKVVDDAHTLKTKELEQELNSTREYLQTVVEELETSNEELQSLNEELQSANEELQSANEELETSNEELQSTNEELSTVNDEIQMKSNELEEANDHLKNIKDSVDVGIVLVDMDMRISLVNKTGRNIFHDDKDVVGENILFQTLRFSGVNLKEKLKTVLEENINISKNIFIDDSLYILKISPFEKSSGEIGGAIITLVNSHDEFDSMEIIEGIYKDGIWEWPDIEKDEEYWSPQWKKMLGYEEDEIEAKASKFFEMIHPEDKMPTEKALKKHLEKGEAFDVEYRLKTKSGEYKWFKGKGKATKNPKTGKTRMIGFISDIDKYKNATLELAMTELANKSFIEASYDGFWDWRINDHYEYMSPRFWEMLGYDAKEKKHHPSEWQKIISGDSLKLALSNFDKHVDTKGEFPYSQEVEFTHKDGYPVHILCRGKVIEWDKEGNPLRMVGTHTDITRLKEAELKLKQYEEEANSDQPPAVN